MAEPSAISAWIVLFMGLYSLGASIGELRAPGSWAAMLDNFSQQDGLRFLTGIVLIALGAAIYLVNPLDPADWMSLLVTVLGGGMALEGFVMLAFGEPFMRFSRALIGGAGRAWAILSALFGVLFIVVALLRL